MFKVWFREWTGVLTVLMTTICWWAAVKGICLWPCSFGEYDTLISKSQSFLREIEITLRTSTQYSNNVACKEINYRNLKRTKHHLVPNISCCGWWDRLFLGIYKLLLWFKPSWQLSTISHSLNLPLSSPCTGGQGRRIKSKTWGFR